MIIKKCIYSFCIAMIRLFFSVKKGRVFCRAWSGKQYNCNPKYITECILKNCPDNFEIFWELLGNVENLHLDSRIKISRGNLLRTLYLLNTAEYLIANNRLNFYGGKWKKRPGQKYIMTWHGSMALKKVEFDAIDCLPESYIKSAIRDSEVTDLLLSDSSWCTEFMRRAFHYEGEILEKGLPRNDIFFIPERVEYCNEQIRRIYDISPKDKIVLYAPTFRTDMSTESYISNWDELHSTLEEYYNTNVCILVKLHPAMIGMNESLNLNDKPFLYNVSKHEDIQELLCASDMLITDYSSIMFEFAYLNKPCFLYVPDAVTYDRGFYFDLETLPFPTAVTNDEILSKIKLFKESEYIENLNRFYSDTLMNIQTANSSNAVVQWMINKRI